MGEYVTNLNDGGNIRFDVRNPNNSGTYRKVVIFGYNNDLSSGKTRWKTVDIDLGTTPKNGAGRIIEITNTVTGTAGSNNYNIYDVTHKGIGSSPTSSGSWTDMTTTITPNFTIHTVGTGAYTAAYQPEDRYAYISNVSGTADSDNFINIVTAVDDPYIVFYTSAGGTGDAINGVNDDDNTEFSTGISLNYTGQTGDGTSNNPYKIRLPKNAKSFAIASGPDGTPGDAYNLYENVNVSGSTGQLASTGDVVPVTNFHHAGSTFSVANDLTITNTAVRANTPVQTDMDNPLNTKSDSDFVFFTVPSNNNWTPYAYFYGNMDGEYDFSQTTITAGTPTTSTITWPGIQASGSPYTDKAGNKVYRFQIPKGNNGTYSYVMFNNGTYESNNITEAVQFTAGGNYTLKATTKNYGGNGTDTYVTAFELDTGTKAPTTATVDYSSGDYIYIINNGTQNAKNNVDSRTSLDEMHVTFFSNANGSTVIGTGSLDADTNAGYIPDKVGTTNESTGAWTALTKDGKSVYRIQVPKGAKYFQINNGLGKGDSGTNYSLRKSEIKALTVNGLYKFVEGNNLDDNKYIVSGTFPADAEHREAPRYLLDLVNIRDEGDEELPDSETVDIHLATVVTGSDGKITSIKWLKDSLTSIDDKYLANTTETVHTDKTVKVKKQGNYYWKEVVAPSGYKINPNVTTFILSGYNATTPPAIVDEHVDKGSLSLSKQLETLKQTEANYGEKKKFIFTVVLTAPLGTKWQTLNTASPLVFQSVTTENNVAGQPVTVTPIKDSFSNDSLTRVIMLEVPATGLTDVIISNIPSGTAYYVTENPVGDLTVRNSTANDVTATVTLTAPSGINWDDYTLTKDGTNITTGVTTSGQVRTVSNISVPANGSVKIGNIPDGTTYSISGGITKNGTVYSEYSKKPTAITKKVYASADAQSTTSSSPDEIEGTIPSFDDNDKNAVDYDVTNKREVGMLTLKDIVIGHNIYPQSLSIKGVNQSTTISGISTTNWYKYDYLVTLIAPEGVDLDDYISKTDLDNVTGYWTLKQDPNNANSLIHDTYHKFNDDDNNVKYTSRNPKTRSATETQSSYTFHINVTSAEDGFKDILNIPLGTQYTVVEQNPTATYDEEYSGQKEGKVTWQKSGDVYPRDAQHSTAPLKYVDAEHRAPVETITNEYWYDEPPHSITIKKKLYSVDVSNDGENENFTFTVTLTNNNIDWTNDHGRLTCTGGTITPLASPYSNSNHTYTFTVSVPATGDTGAVVIGNIPHGTAYLVSETIGSNQHYTLTSINDAAATSTQVSGESLTADVSYTFTNKREVHSLTLQKQLAGEYSSVDGIDEYKTFPYVVELTAPENVDLSDYLTAANITDLVSGTTVTPTTSGTTVTKYTINIPISQNGPQTISNIPYGTTYKVTENYSYNSNGISCTPAVVTGSGLNGAEDTMDGNKTVKYENNYVESSKGSIVIKKKL